MISTQAGLRIAGRGCVGEFVVAVEAAHPEAAAAYHEGSVPAADLLAGRLAERGGRGLDPGVAREIQERRLQR